MSNSRLNPQEDISQASSDTAITSRGDGNKVDETATHSHTWHTVRTVGLAGVSLVIIVGLCIFVGISSTIKYPIDIRNVTNSTTHSVKQTQIMQYCPAQMKLADSDAYGDSEYQATEGDLTGSTLVTAFGSVFSSNLVQVSDASQVQAVASGSDSSSAGTSNDDYLAHVLGTSSQSSYWFNTQILSADQGNGAVGSTASWATTGDLTGIASTTCVTSALKQSFLVPSASSGWAQQLVIANSSTKATTVTLTAYSADSSGKLALLTNATSTVAASSETTVNLSAAIQDQNAAYITLTSSVTPVAAVVRVNHVDGLTAKGIDYANAISTTSKQQVIPTVDGASAVSLSLFAKKSGTVKVSWITEDGLAAAKTISIDANQVSLTDLGSIPSKAKAIYINSSVAVSASAELDTSQSGQSDFALINGQNGAELRGLTIPSSTSANVTVTNTSSKDISARIKSYNSSSKHVGTKTITIPAQSSVMLSSSSLGDSVAAITAQRIGTDSQEDEEGTNVEEGSIVLGATLSNSSLNDADTRAITALESTSLQPSVTRINTSFSNSLVN